MYRGIIGRYLTGYIEDSIADFAFSRNFVARNASYIEDER
jgi:hypothetical protein